METKEEYKTVKDIVNKLLERDERARNDDKYLTFLVMRHFTNIYIPFEDFDKIPSFDTVRRVRAHIQNTLNKFPPTDPKVIARRQQRQVDVKEVLANE